MKPAISWIKSNLMIVVFTVVILLVLPASYIVSNAWGASIRTDRENKANDLLKKVNAATTDYAIPQYDPASTALTHKAPPNKQLIDWFKAKRDEFATASGEIVKRAEDFNRGVGPDAQAVGRREHRAIVDGLFPASRAQAEAELKAELTEEKWNALPEDDRKSKIDGRVKAKAQDKLYEAEDAFLGRRGHPSPYAKLLEAIHAGPGADITKLTEDITALRTAEIQKIGARRDLTQEESDKLLKQLEERRLGGYQARARDVSVYAGMDVFPTDDKQGSAIRLDSFDPREVDPYHFFIFQWDLWVLSDLTSAVGLANRGPDGKLLPVDQSTVKRILSIRLQDPEGLVSGGTAGFGGAAATPPTASVPGMVPTDPTLGLTARGSGSWNTVYDIRKGTMSVVVASARLADFLDAIERTNFMTVTGLKVSDVKVWDDLKQGYYYGTDHVVQADIEIETIWLRSWMTKVMPDDIQSVLGVPGAAGDGPAASSSPAAAPAAAPTPPSNRMPGNKGAQPAPARGGKGVPLPPG